MCLLCAASARMSGVGQQDAVFVWAVPRGARRFRPGQVGCLPVTVGQTFLTNPKLNSKDSVSFYHPQDYKIHITRLIEKQQQRSVLRNDKNSTLN